MIPVAGGWSQDAVDVAADGLPTWLFYLLICVILFLLVFIFLRDKDLRRRLSAFLSSAKRKMVRFRLQARVKKEKARKTQLWLELGKAAWGEDIPLESAADIRGRLAALEEERQARQLEWQDLYARIEALSRVHQEARTRHMELLEALAAERRPHADRHQSFEARLQALAREAEQAPERLTAAEYDIRATEEEMRSAVDDPKLSDADRTARHEKGRAHIRDLLALQEELRARGPGLEAERAAHSAEEAKLRLLLDENAARRDQALADWQKRENLFQTEMDGLQKARDRVQDRLVEIKRLSEPLFESFGKAVDEARPMNETLALLYFQIDGVERRIQDLLARIENLH
jgi:chromosome segregation ATPase